MFKQMVLSNGIRVVNEHIEFAKTVSMGLFVKAGSIYESPENNGVSHFIEHMVFKGTEKRTAHDIAEEMDNMGGLLNAYTSKECTCYHTNVLAEYVECAFEMISDIVLHPTLSQEDIDLERKVIYEEIAMYEDSPEDLVGEIWAENVYRGCSQSLTVLGTYDSLAGINRQEMLDYMNSRYVTENFVISFAGAISDDEAYRLAEKYFGEMERKSSVELVATDRVIYTPCVVHKKKEIEQVHIMVGFEGYDLNNELRYSLAMFNAILGGGMSSVLFQSIREKLGLVYSIYSYSSSGSVAGSMGIYAGTNQKYAEQVLELIGVELRKIIDEGVSKKQLDKVKNQYRCSYLMSSERINTVMKNNGVAMVVSNRITTEEQFLEILANITQESIAKAVGGVVLQDKASIATVGIGTENLKFKL